MEEESSSLTQFQDLLREWETDHIQQHYDPTSLLEGMAEILEKETNVYMASDPGRGLSKQLDLFLQLFRSVRGETSLPGHSRLSIRSSPQGLLQEREFSP